jgi:hypothetical protein
MKKDFQKRERKELAGGKDQLTRCLFAAILEV